MNQINEHSKSRNLQRAATIIVIIFLIILVASSFNVIQAKVKDSKRRVDLKQLRTALELYRAEYGHYPEEEANNINGWELSWHQGNKDEKNFLKILVDKGFLEEVVVDPVNSESHHYRYQRFDKGSFGCQKPFYVLQVLNFEQPSEDIGFGKCSQKSFVDQVPNGYTIQIFE